jgi:glycosyltransferase involved in cell wall biosynthesis
MSYPNTAFLLDSGPRVWSSLEDQHLQLCRELSARGSKPLLIFAKALPTAMQERFERAGAGVAAINYEDGAVNYYKELQKLIERNSLERFHVTFFDYFRAIGWLARLQGTQSIVYEMGNGGVFKAQSWKRQLLRFRNRVMTAPFVRVIAISEYIKEQLIAAGIPEEKISVRYLGVDTERFKPDDSARTRLASEYAIGPDEIVLSTVSYLRPIKNPQIIVQACGLLAQRGVRARLFVAGDGEMWAELQRLTAQLGITERVHWLGLVSNPVPLLQASDLFLLATVGEAFGLVLPEAMACGVPVVGAYAGAIPEVVKDGETGLLVKPLDAVSLADGIEKLARNTALRKTMARQATARVTEMFTLKQSAANTLKIYDSLSGTLDYVVGRP